MPIEPAWLQAVFTLVLVIVTAYYTYLLHRQNNRERRISHTDTLRKRVQEWHQNLPEVRPTDVDSAERNYVLGEVDAFQVVPARLEDDNYFQDLLDNHGSELQQHKTRIEELHEQFTSLKKEFIMEFSDTEPVESACDELEATDQYPEWVFNQALRLERTEREKNGLHEMAVQALEQNTSIGSDEKRYPSNAGNSYSVIITKPRDDSAEDDKKIVADVIAEAINRVDDYDEYDIAVEAASILDKIESRIERLEAKLTEYDGMATYPGDCEYI